MFGFDFAAAEAEKPRSRKAGRNSKKDSSNSHSGAEAGKFVGGLNAKRIEAQA